MLENGAEAEETLEVTTVDESVPLPISFMKMDIEGSELQALRGAAHQIEENRPKLAVCVYHKPEYFLEIWKYLRKLLPESRFFLRHHSPDNGTETVLYATT